MLHLRLAGLRAVPQYADYPPGKSYLVREK
jgi:hypothetical protein